MLALFQNGQSLVVRLLPPIGHLLRQPQQRVDQLGVPLHRRLEAAPVARAAEERVTGVGRGLAQLSQQIRG